MRRSSTSGRARARRAPLAPLPVITLILITVAVVIARPETPAGAQDPSGEDVFATNCASCHQADGGGIEGTFPPLLGNPAAADPATVEAAVTTGVSGPLEVLGVPYDSVMPPLTGLSDAEVAAVVDYVVGLAGEASGAEAGSAAGSTATTTAGGSEEAAAPAGDAAQGQRLFTGADRLAAGAPACHACHAAGSVDDLGGSGLGPDLTTVHARLGGDVGLSAWLADPPSATMAPVFGSRPLSPQEVADLVAFLASTPAEPEAAPATDRLTTGALVAVALLLAAMAFLGRGARRPFALQLRSRR
ncbi:MAG: c-type cytochrome [Acidimicrobiales bacterium]